MSGFSSIPMRDDMINAAVNALYKNLGTDKIKTTEAIQKRGVDSNWDGFISKDELKDAIKGDKVALSLKEYKEGGFDGLVRLFNAADVSSDIADRMDGSDGTKDGLVNIRGYQVLSASSLSLSLTSGTAVIGREIQDRTSAKRSGLTLIELHQNDKGPKLVVGQ